MKSWQIYFIACVAFCGFLNAQTSPTQSDFLPKTNTPQADNSGQALEQTELEKQDSKDEVLLKSTSTNSFQILSENALCFAQLRDVIKTAEGIITEYLGLSINTYQKIRLQVIADTDKEYKDQFYVDIYKDGSIYLMLRWDENLEYDKFCSFIMGAMLRKIAIDRNQNIENISYFLELGLSALLEQRTTKALVSKFAKETKSTKLLGLKESLDMQRDENFIKRNKLSAHWNLLALKKLYKDKNSLNNTLQKILNTKGDFYEEISTYSNIGEFEKYFKCIVNSEISLRSGGVMDMEDSADELLSLSFIRKDSLNQAFGDKAIFENRDDKEVLEAIKKRIMEIKLLLPRINPIYFNALLSLGEMFESAENDDYSDFENARLDFIGYFKQAKYLEQRANDLLAK